MKAQTTHRERVTPTRPVRLERMEEDPKSAWIARLMDTVFVIPGTKIRFGFDAIIGLFPGVGDTIGAFISTFIVAQASRMGVPRIVLIRMALNILTNTLVGMLPILGDIFSVFYRSNSKNYELLRRYAGQQTQARASDWLFVISFVAVLVGVLVGMVVVVVVLIKKLISIL